MGNHKTVCAKCNDDGKNHHAQIGDEWFCVKCIATKIAELEQRLNATYCAYCGEAFPMDTVTADQVGEHAKKRPKHPLAALKKQIAELQYQHDADASTIEALKGELSVAKSETEKLKQSYKAMLARVE